MSFIHPRLRPQIDVLSPQIRSSILKSNAKFYTQDDLDTFLERHYKKHTLETKHS